MREAAASNNDPAVAPRLGRSGLRWGDPPSAAAAAGGALPEGAAGMSSALNSRDVKSSHSREREKCGAWLCRRAREVASAIRPYEQRSTSSVKSCESNNQHWNLPYMPAVFPECFVRH